MTSLTFITYPFFCTRTYRSSRVCQRRWQPSHPHHRVLPRMSGVNGGIDYEIDLTTLPESLAQRIRYVQQGPDSPTELISAAEEIATASRDEPQILPVLVDMLGFNNPVAANIAIDGLAASKTASIPSLLTGVAAFNYSVNAYALRALARIGDPTVLGVCLACARDGPIPNVRRAACRALAALQYHTQQDATTAYQCLLALADREPDWGVRYAAIAALEGFIATDLITECILDDGLNVVRAASNGQSNVSKEAEQRKQHDDSISQTQTKISADPTVMARAALAFERMSITIKELQSI